MTSSATNIHGVGKVTVEALARAGLHTIGDLQDYRGELRALVGSYAPIIRRYAMGEDDRALEFDGEVKSVSAEETFERDTDDRRVLVPALKDQPREVAEKLGKERLVARTVLRFKGVAVGTFHTVLVILYWSIFWFVRRADSICRSTLPIKSSHLIVGM